MVSAVVRLDIARFQGGRSFNDVHNVINTDIFMVYVRRILTTLDTEGFMLRPSSFLNSPWCTPSPPSTPTDSYSHPAIR